MKVAIVSGKGGCGKSSVSAAFVSLAGKVVAVDCDVDASNLPLVFSPEPLMKEVFVSGSRLVVDREACILCGQCVENCAFGALTMGEKGPESNPFLCEGCGLCTRLCPRHALKLEPEAGSAILTGRISNGFLLHGELQPGDDNSGKMIARIRCLADACMEREDIGLQILDGPPGIGCPVLSTLTGVDRVVLVCEPSLSGLEDFSRIHEVASSFCSDISVIVNKCDISVQTREEIVSRCAVLGIPVIAELPFDRCMVDAQLQRRSVVDSSPDSVAAEQLSRAYRKVCLS